MPADLKVPYTIAKLDEAPAPLRPFYAAKDGTFQLQLDGEHPDSVKLAEFRENNRALNASKGELEAKLKAFDGIDPVKAKEALAKPDAAPRAAELAEQLQAEQNARAAAEVKHAVGFEFLRAGGRAEALDFVVAEAQKTFTWKDDALITKALSPTNAGKPLSITEWVAQQARTAAFAFKPSVGGGANGSSGNRPAPKPTIDGSDPAEFGRHLADIASGRVTVKR